MREKYRGGKLNKKGKQSATMSLWDNLNYLNKLISQDPFSDRFTVVYNESGTTIRCAVIKSNRVIFEHKTYYYYAESEEEAYYLAGILNSDSVIEVLRKTGILSERGIEKKVFELTIPLFDIHNTAHKKISLMSKEISESLENGGELDTEDNVKRFSKINELCKQIITGLPINSQNEVE